MSVIPPAILLRLLGAIEADNLVMLCGAGLSVPPPAKLMSAQRVSQVCYERWLPTAALPANMRDDIDALSGHFYANDQFESVFINALVPWNDLVGQPNGGHAATADFLISRAAKAALSSNFDPLIESWAMQRKNAMQGALSGQEASSAAFLRVSNPLLKFHGCLLRGRNETLWTQGQLGEPSIAQRVQSCSQWMTMNLPGADLLVVGFWSDWGYLNDVIANALAINGAASITVVDPAPTADLQTKAPNLWARLTGTGAPFSHVQESGEAFLAELRGEFSKVWARKFFALGRPLLEADGLVYAPALVDPSAMTVDDLYDLRRDGDGTPYHRAATRKAPDPTCAQAAYAHLLLIHAHAARNGPWYDYGGRRIRVVHGGGQSIGVVRQAYDEAPAISPPDIVVCAGAVNLGTPGRIISSGRGASVVRPSVGGTARWLTLDEAKAELGI
jgi:hypothetical protein